MHIKKTLTLKGTKKSEEKPELQKRKSNLFNEKLELIKISKYTHTKKYTHTAALCIDSQREKQWSKTTQHGLSVKGKKNPNTLTRTRTQTHRHTHRHTKKQNKNPVFLNGTLDLQQTQIQNYFTMLPFLIQKMPIVGVYIYIYIYFSVVYC